MKGYLIVGKTYCYNEDNHVWYVKIFTNEGKAIELLKNLNKEVLGSHTWNYKQRENFKHPLDPKCEVYPDGTRYELEEIEIEIE